MASLSRFDSVNTTPAKDLFSSRYKSSPPDNTWTDGANVSFGRDVVVRHQGSSTRKGRPLTFEELTTPFTPTERDPVTPLSTMDWAWVDGEKFNFTPMSPDSPCVVREYDNRDPRSPERGPGLTLEDLSTSHLEPQSPATYDGEEWTNGADVSFFSSIAERFASLGLSTTPFSSQSET